MKQLDVVALGGNAILPAGKAGTIREQVAITETAMEQIAGLLEDGRHVVLTHGNGPIVGNIVIRNEAVKDTIAPMPLDVCVADSQGGIGYMIQQTLRNVLAKHGIAKEVVTVITQVRVDPNDPAFGNPAKPIGPFYTEKQAKDHANDRGWAVIKDSNRGYRRAVPSPYPLEIMEKRVVSALVRAGAIVVTVGGGGIPVVFADGRYQGCEAVVDKDLASSLLARELGAERLIILTDVDAVYRDFGTPQAAAVRSATLAEVKDLADKGQFPAGSMGSKIRAGIEFLEHGGRSVVICRAEHMLAATRGEKGTTMRRGRK